MIWTQPKYLWLLPKSVLSVIWVSRKGRVHLLNGSCCSGRVSIYPTFARHIENSLQKLILSFRYFLAPLCVALVAYVECAERDLLKAMYNAAKWPLNDPFEWSPPSTQSIAHLRNRDSQLRLSSYEKPTCHFLPQPDVELLNAALWFCSQSTKRLGTPKKNVNLIQCTGYKF